MNASIKANHFILELILERAKNMKNITSKRISRLAILCFILATTMVALRILDIHSANETASIQIAHSQLYPQKNTENIPLNYSSHQVIVNTQLGFPLVVDNRDGIVGKYLLNSGLWEQNISQVLNRLVAKGDTVVEVGANYGYHTIHVSQLIGDSGKLFTYEANDEVCHILNKNIILNDAQHNTHMRCLAVLDNFDKADFLTGYSNLGGSFVIGPHADRASLLGSEQYNGWKKKAVLSTTLDYDLKDLQNIDILRMDAEGAELAIIKGASRLIDASPNLKLIMEWDVSMLGRFGKVASMLDHLENKGFKFYFINEDSTLSQKNKFEMLSLPHCDLVLSRTTLQL